jgi:hypothetical protein
MSLLYNNECRALKRAKLQKKGPSKVKVGSKQGHFMEKSNR